MSRATGKCPQRLIGNCIEIKVRLTLGRCKAGQTGRQRTTGRNLTADRTLGLSTNAICDSNHIPLLPLQVGTDTSGLRKADPKGRSALLADIQQGTRLRKVTQINDRSAPQIESKCTPEPGRST